jgi:hypothetical protein
MRVNIKVKNETTSNQTTDIVNTLKEVGLDDYRFMSDEDPTDEQLAALMSEVTKDVKERWEVANKKFWDELNIQFDKAIEKSKELI